MVAIALALAIAYPALVAATSTTATSAGHATPQSKSATQTTGPNTTISHYYEPSSTTHRWKRPGKGKNDVPRLEHSDNSLDYPTQKEPYPDSTVHEAITKTYNMEGPVTPVAESDPNTPNVTLTYSMDVVHLESSALALVVPTEKPAPGNTHSGPGDYVNPAPAPGYSQPSPPPESTEAVQSQPGAGSGMATGNGAGDALLVPGSSAGSSTGYSAEAIVVTDSSSGSIPTTLVTTMPGSITTINGQVFTAPPAVYTFTLAAGSQEGNGYSTGSGTGIGTGVGTGSGTGSGSGSSTVPSNSEETEGSTSPSEAAGQAPTSSVQSSDSKVEEGGASRWITTPLMGIWLVTMGALALI